MNRFGAAVIGLLAAAWLMFVAAVYLPDVGRGFVKDDFGWVEAGQRAARAPAGAILLPRTGFYRPLVDLSFAADSIAYGMKPRGYGFTNLALYIACVGAIGMLGRALRLSPPAAAVAALAWAVNPHGINMAVVWISGRTSLWLTLCAVLSAIAMLRQRHVWMAAALMGALASKEEAVVLPFVLLAWHALLMRDGTASRRTAIAALVPLAVYAAMRTHATAFTPMSAPAYYQFSFSPETVAYNLFEYVDRGATVALIALALAVAVLRVRPDAAGNRRVIGAGAVWFLGGYALTVFLPIRSSLYAVFPSVGAAIACAAVVDRMIVSPVVPRRRVIGFAAAAAATLVAAIPIYRARNGRYVEPARLSERALRTIAAETTTVPQPATIVLHDTPDPMSSFVGAFGTFATNAVRLESGRDVNVWIDPPPGGWQLAGLRPPDANAVAIAFAVDRGRVFKIEE
jgi:hypothetical protein